MSYRSREAVGDRKDTDPPRTPPSRLGSFLGGAALLCLACPPAGASEIDSEYIFGFTQGSEIGHAGEVAVRADSAGRIGAQRGGYSAFSSDLTALYTLTDSLRVAPVFTVDSFAIRDVPGLANRSGTAFEGPSLELKYRLLDYKTDPLGLTFGATPFYARVDAGTGERVRAQGSTFLLSADRALVPERVFGAVNLAYGVSRTFPLAPGGREDRSSLSASGALALQIAEGVTIGAEVRYLRAYDGLGLDRGIGDALYAGPNAYAKLGERAFVSAGLNVRVAGRQAAASAGAGIAGGPAQDGSALTGLERYQLIVRAGSAF